MLSLLRKKKVQAEKMATSKEKPSPSLRNCKQAFTEQEWDQARQSSDALWNQIIKDNNLRYNDLMDNKNKTVQLDLIGNIPMTIKGKVTRVINNREIASVQLSPAWINGVRKLNHNVHLDIIEKITPIDDQDEAPLALEELMHEMEIDDRPNELLPSISSPFDGEKEKSLYSRAVKRPRPSFPSLNVRKGDDNHFSMLEMEKALSENDPNESPDHKRHMAEALGCEKISLEKESKNEILYKLWIQHVDNNLQQQVKNSDTWGVQPKYTEVFLQAFQEVGIILEYGEMRRTLKNIKITPPWLENDLKNIFETVTNITNIRLPKVRLCPGNMKNNFSQAHICS